MHWKSPPPWQPPPPPPAPPPPPVPPPPSPPDPLAATAVSSVMTDPHPINEIRMEATTREIVARRLAMALSRDWRSPRSSLSIVAPHAVALHKIVKELPRHARRLRRPLHVSPALTELRRQVTPREALDHHVARLAPRERHHVARRR